MPIIGSSSIIPSASIGPQGPTGLGALGPTGASGPTGPTGGLGVTGNYVVSTRHDFPNLFVLLSDGSEIKVEGVAGPTGEIGDADGANLGSGVGIFKEVSGGITFWFKGISAEGSLIVYETENTIGISGDALTQLGATAEISDRLRFAYLSAGNTADVSGLTFDTGLTGTIIFGHGPTGNRWSYDPEEIVVYVPEVNSTETVTIYGNTCLGDCGQTAGNGVGIQLGVTSGTIFDVQTPIGIAGFTGDFNNDETYRFTMMLHGNDIWDWPKNVYFDETNIFFSCGTDIVSFLSNNGGDTWYANISSKAYGVGECESFYFLGSCCYTDDNGSPFCEDYISQNDCDTKTNSTWNPMATCANNCGVDGSGICCSEGGDWNAGKKAVCIEGVGPAECSYFNGQFWDYMYYELGEDGLPEPLAQPIPLDCEATTNNETLHSEICINPCDDGCIACCKNGSCIGDLNGSTSLGPISAFACTYVYGGVPIYDTGERRGFRDFGGGDEDLLCGGGEPFGSPNLSCTCPNWPEYNQGPDPNPGRCCVTRKFNDLPLNQSAGFGLSPFRASTITECHPVSNSDQCCEYEQFEYFPDEGFGGQGERYVFTQTVRFEPGPTFLNCSDKAVWGNQQIQSNPPSSSCPVMGACCLGPGSPCQELDRCSCESLGGNWIGNRRCVSQNARHHSGNDGRCMNDQGTEFLPDIDCSEGLCIRSRDRDGRLCREVQNPDYNDCFELVSGPGECVAYSGGKSSWQGYGSFRNKCNRPSNDFPDDGTCHNMTNPPNDLSCINSSNIFGGYDVVECMEDFGGKFTMSGEGGFSSYLKCPGDCEFTAPPPPEDAPGFNPDCASCGTVDCCDHVTLYGACCVQAEERCYDNDVKTCRDMGGVFMGPKTTCEDVNCCFDEIGWCCSVSSGEECVPTYEDECYGEFYSYSEYGDDAQSVCDEECSPNIVYCCLPNGNCSQTTEEECEGNYYSTIEECIGNCTQESLGACCDGQSCNTRTESYCASTGGTWYGQDFQECYQNCGPNGTCCYFVGYVNPEADHPSSIRRGFLKCEENVTRSECIQLSNEDPGNVYPGAVNFVPGVGPEYSCDEIGCFSMDIDTRACISCPDTECDGINCCCPDGVGPKGMCFNLGAAFSFDHYNIIPPAFRVPYYGDLTPTTDAAWLWNLALRTCFGPIQWEAFGLPELMGIPVEDFPNYWASFDTCGWEITDYDVIDPDTGTYKVVYGGSCHQGVGGGCEPYPILGYWCVCGCGDANYFGPVCPGDGEEGCPCRRNCRFNHTEDPPICGMIDPCEDVECSGEISEWCGPGGRSNNNETGISLVRIETGECVWMIDGTHNYPRC